MGVIYVARSVKFGKWASDVGLSKHVFKLGVAEGDPKEAAAQGWGGENDWTILRKREVDGVTEQEAIDRLQRKEKMIDPTYYPRLRGAVGVFKVLPEHVENHIIVSRTLAGESDRIELKLKPADFADYLIHNALR
ncbi:MAG TPA: hypothetical protein VN668_14940 [Stellaceae bacterium]|nr:hypothetical protein [Stellaceae bacterium]